MSGAENFINAWMRPPRVLFEPSSHEVVDAMLELARVDGRDTVYDLGCGDGRIVIAAAKRGATGVGVDADPRRIEDSRQRAADAGVAERVTFVHQDMYATDVTPATVVMLYLLPEANMKLRSRLISMLRPGSRIVSHSHDMGDWYPDLTALAGGDEVHLWFLPPNPLS